jgi:hypothetical protein
MVLYARIFFVNDILDTLQKSQQLVDMFKNGNLNLFIYYTMQSWLSTFFPIGMQDMDNSKTIILKKIESMNIGNSEYRISI